MLCPREESVTSSGLLARLATPPPSPSFGPAFDSSRFLHATQKVLRKLSTFWSGAPARNRTSIAGSAILRPIR